MTTNWNIVPAPTPDWAEAVYPDLEPEEAYERLWEQVAHICRLDADDPGAAWTSRIAELKANAGGLNERGFDAIRLHGPGTDLTIGLLPSARWQAGDIETVDGLHHFPNIPTEETFTTPDPERVDGYVSATMPLELAGSVISGIRVEFSGGRAVAIDADRGADALRAAASSDAGAARLGELALVDGAGRIGPLGDGLLRHADRRERGHAHRARRRLRPPGRRRGREEADQQEPRPHRLHDREPEARGRRDHPRRRRGARPPRRRLADLARAQDRNPLARISIARNQTPSWGARDS